MFASFYEATRRKKKAKIFNMATKNHCLSGKNDLIFGEPLNDQYSNLNLNQKNQTLHADIAQSQSATNSSRKNENYDFTDSVDLQAKRESSSWNKSNKHLSSNILNLKQKSEEEDELEKTKNTNNSTLSLHIAAYENSIEADTSDLNECESEASKSKHGKTPLVKYASSFIQASFDIDYKTLFLTWSKDLFEFPRQQEDPSNQPEVMQFKSSQRLRNPNQENLNVNKRKTATVPASIVQSNEATTADKEEEEQPQNRQGDGDNDGSHECCRNLLKEKEELHRKEIEKYLKEISELKEQLQVDKCVWSLFSVLRENGDTIIVAEREMNLISQGMKDLSERSEAVYLHLSSIAKDFCQKLDDFQSGLEKRQSTLPSPGYNSSHSNIGDFMGSQTSEYARASEIAQTAELAQKLEIAERRLKEAEDRNIHIQEFYEERLQTLSDLGEGDSTFRVQSPPQTLDTSEFVHALQQETGMLRKDYNQKMVTYSLRQGAIKPEEAYRQLVDADALGDLTLDDLKVMTPKKKTPLKKMMRVFSTKK